MDNDMNYVIPKKCSECIYLGHYEIDYLMYGKEYYCCELLWTLIHEDYRVKPESLDTRCPLKDSYYMRYHKRLCDGMGIKMEDFTNHESDSKCK